MMKKFIPSLVKSFKGVIANNEYFIKLQKKYPRFFESLKKRFSLTEKYGLFFTIGILLSAVFFIYFLSIVQDVLAKDPFIKADIRIMNLIAAYRSIWGAKILLLFTYLGNSQIIISLGFIVLVALWLLNRKQDTAILIGGVAIGELLSFTIKLLLHRHRPDIGFSLIPEEGYSFISGHAVRSMIFYGLTAYFLSKPIKKWRQKTLVCIPIIVLIFLIGFSRLYLGVHWASDVVAGWLLGFSVFVLLITLFEVKKNTNKPILSKKFIAFIVILLLILEGIFVYYFYQMHPLAEPQIPAAQVITIVTPSEFQSLLSSYKFPKYTETLVGQKMEPVSFIIIAQKDNLINAFQKAGWFAAGDPHNIVNIYRLVIAAAFNLPYPTAPITPSFWDRKPNDIGFQKPTNKNSVRQRHHIRFWQTNYYLNGTPIWVATASFDEGLRYFITHKIRPDVDTERDFIKDNLVNSGSAENMQEIQLVDRLMGKNQGGDEFFTDGKAYIVFIKQ